MEHIVGRFDDRGLTAELGKAGGERLGAATVGAVGQADHHALGGHQHIAAVNMAGWQVEHDFELLAKGGDKLGSFGGSAWGTRAEQDRSFRKDQSGVFDEQGIGETFERLKDR